MFSPSVVLSFTAAKFEAPLKDFPRDFGLKRNYADKREMPSGQSSKFSSNCHHNSYNSLNFTIVTTILIILTILPIVTTILIILSIITILTFKTSAHCIESWHMRLVVLIPKPINTHSCRWLDLANSIL